MTNTFQKKLAASMIAVAAFSMSSAAVFAQQAQTPSPSGSQSAFEIDQNAIDNFAGASIDVQKILIDWEPRISGAQTEAQVQVFRENQKAELVAALDDHNLDISTYNRIFQAANNDPALAERIQKRQTQLQSQAQ